MARSAEELKQLSIKEFTEAAKVYESGHAGIYEMCKDDYPQMLEELELEPFEDALDVGRGTGAVLELLHARYPSKHLTGLDLTPGMIDVARAKQLDNVSFVVGDAEALPFEPRSFDAVLCSNSFHHYPHPERFFAEVARVLRPGGRLVLRDYTSNDVAVWLMNNIELPLARLLGHGDVRIWSRERASGPRQDAPSRQGTPSTPPHQGTPSNQIVATPERAAKPRRAATNVTARPSYQMPMIRRSAGRVGKDCPYMPAFGDVPFLPALGDCPQLPGGERVSLATTHLRTSPMTRFRT